MGFRIISQNGNQTRSSESMSNEFIRDQNETGNNTSFSTHKIVIFFSIKILFLIRLAQKSSILI